MDDTAIGTDRERASAERQVVTFRVGSEEYGVDIAQVREIIGMKRLTRMPDSPDWMEGIMEVRTEVLPVVSLAKRFGVQSQGEGCDRRVMIADSGGKVVGLAVDSVSEVLRVPDEHVDPVPQMLGAGRSKWFEGIARVGQRLVILVDLRSMVIETVDA